MKKLLLSLLMVSVVIGLIVIKGIENNAFAAEGALKPVVTLETHYVQMDNKAKIVIMGAGFQPGQKPVLLIKTADDVETDLSPLLEPSPEANNTGTWATTWDCGTLIKSDLINKGVYTITVTDSDYKDIAIVPVSFYEKKKDDKKGDQKKEK